MLLTNHKWARSYSRERSHKLRVQTKSRSSILHPIVFGFFLLIFFQLAGAALLDTLDKGLGEKFTSEVKEAWSVVYGIIADTMKAGAKEVLEG